MKKSFLIITLIVATGFSVMAQPARPGKGVEGPGPFLAERIPDLTEEQRDQIHELRKNFMDYSLEKRAKLKVLHSEYEYLLISDVQNLEALDKNIEERSALRTELMKEKTRMQLSIRELLTDEQQLIFDHRILKQGPERNGAGSERMGPPVHSGGRKG